MLESARYLALHGALWRPDDGRQMQDVRRSLYKCEPAITVEVVKMSPDTMSVRKRNSKSFWTLRRMRAHGALSGRAFPWTGQQDSVGFEAIGDSSRNTGWVTGPRQRRSASQAGSPTSRADDALMSLRSGMSVDSEEDQVLSFACTAAVRIAST